MPIEIKLETRIELSDGQAQLVSIHGSLVDAGEAALGSINATGQFEHAVALLIGQAVASARALEVLCLAGRARQAYPTARSIVEHVINAHYIARDRAVRAGRFWAHRPIPLAKMAEARFKAFGITDELDAIRAQAVEAKKSLHPHKHWAGSTDLRSRANECGMEAIYDLYYPEGSGFAHGDASIWNALISEDGASMKLGPSPAGLEAVLAPAITALYAGLLLVADVFKNRDLNKRLDQVAQTLPPRTGRIDLTSHFEFLRTRR